MESYSLEGEDLILSRYFSNRVNGLYVDVGAYHPTKYSNTFLFYKKGWSGVNIDATPGSMDLFISTRPNDVNLEFAISANKLVAEYYCFEESALNSFDKKISLDRHNRGCRLIDTTLLPTYALSEILDKYIPDGSKIDFMSIDTEGMDLEVLKSNNWEKYRPEVLVIECSSFNNSNVMDFEGLDNNDIYNYVLAQGYIPFAKTIDNVLLKRSLKHEYWFNSELKEQRLVRNLVSSGMLVFDVGTNIGKYTKLFSLLVAPKGLVFAFEPSQKSYQETMQTVNEVGYNNVTCINKAIFSENTILTFNEFPDEYSSWNSIGRPAMVDPKDATKIVPIVKSTSVEAITLDSFCRDHHIEFIDYLKLDVEGAEIFALHGAKGLLANKKIRYLQFEISKHMLDGLNTDAESVFDYLYSAGYQAHEIIEDGSIGEQIYNSNAFYDNYIAMPSAIAPSNNTTTVNVCSSADKDAFTDNGLWTPQTQMLQSICAWVMNSELFPINALSIDVNPDLDLILRQKWSGFSPTIAKYPQADVQNLSRFPDESFDIVYSHQVLEHVPKPWIAAQEILRVTRKGGFGIHTTCAFNPRHGLPAFNDYYRFLPDGIAELFDGVNVLLKGEWGNRQAILYNVGIDDGHGDLGGRRLPKSIGSLNDGLYPWVTWIIYEKRK